MRKIRTWLRWRKLIKAKKNYPRTLTAYIIEYLYFIIEKEDELNPLSLKDQQILNHYMAFDKNEAGRDNRRLKLSTLDFLRIKNLKFYCELYTKSQYPELFELNATAEDLLLIKQHFSSNQTLFECDDTKFHISLIYKDFQWEYFIIHQKPFPKDFDKERREFFRFARLKLKSLLVAKYAQSIESSP